MEITHVYIYIHIYIYIYTYIYLCDRGGGEPHVTIKWNGQKKCDVQRTMNKTNTVSRLTYGPACVYIYICVCVSPAVCVCVPGCPYRVDGTTLK